MRMKNGNNFILPSIPSDYDVLALSPLTYSLYLFGPCGDTRPKKFIIIHYSSANESSEETPSSPTWKEQLTTGLEPLLVNK